MGAASAAQLLAVGALALSTLLGCAWRQSLLADASAARSLAHATRLRTARLQLLRQRSAANLSLSSLRLSLASSLLAERRARMLGMARELEAAQMQVLATRKPADAQPSHREFAIRSVWHGIASDGSCPAQIPQWDWRVLLAAARARESHERGAMLEELRRTSRLPLGELQQLVSRYSQVLSNPEFVGILDVDNQPCKGRRFAWLEGDRLLIIECQTGKAR